MPAPLEVPNRNVIERQAQTLHSTLEQFGKNVDLSINSVVMRVHSCVAEASTCASNFANRLMSKGLLPQSNPSLAFAVSLFVT